MNHYQNHVTIAASLAAVYTALATEEGVRGWWTEDCDFDGDLIALRFGPTHKRLRIAQGTPHHELHWLCEAAHIGAGKLSTHDEWVGTRMVFRLSPEGEGTRVDFEHIGLVPALECWEMCNNGWRYFLESLRQYVVAGTGTPYKRALETAV
jgi:uncharacterized protein YndB with AHSA1/START domain